METKKQIFQHWTLLGHFESCITFLHFLHCVFFILKIYFLSFRQGYEGDGVRSCEVGFPAIFIPPAPARNNIRIYNYSKQILIQNKIVFVPIYTTQNLFWNSMKAVTNPPPPRLQAPPSKSLCTLACGQNAHCEVDSFILNRPHHHHYYIISYLHNEHHHHYDKVESGNTLYM